MHLRTLTPPAVEPVSVADAKADWKVDGSDEDAIIARRLAAARERIETATSRRLITQTLVGVLDTWPAETATPDEDAPIVAPPAGSAAYVQFPVAPVASIIKVELLDEDGVASEWASADGWYFVRGAGYGRLMRRDGTAWPTPLRAAGGIEITFVVGYGAAGTDVPFPLREAILRLAGHWYEHREAADHVPREVASLVGRFTRLRIG